MPDRSDIYIVSPFHLQGMPPDYLVPGGALVFNMGLIRVTTYSAVRLNGINSLCFLPPIL